MTDYGRRLDFDNYCGKQVGRGFITFPCRLDRGHPESEPCVAPEVPHSVRLHDVWEGERKTAKAPEAPVPAPESERAPESEPESQTEVEALLSRAVMAMAELEDVIDYLRKIANAED